MLLSFLFLLDSLVDGAGLVEPGDGVGGEGAWEDVCHGFGSADGFDGELLFERRSVKWLWIGDVGDGLDFMPAWSGKVIHLLPGRAVSCWAGQGDG